MRILIHEWVSGGGLVGRDVPASWGREGVAMREALADDFRHVAGVTPIVTVDPRFANGGAPVQRLVVSNAEDAIAYLRPSRSWDRVVLIAPETDGVLHALATRLAEWGAPSLGASPSAIALTTDKLELARLLEGLGVRTPETRPFDPVSGAGLPERFPVVIKPRDGAGSLDTWVVESREELPRVEPREGGWIAQPFVAGRALSLSLLVAPGGAIQVLGLGRQDIRVERGRIRYQGGEVPVDARGPLAEVLRAARAIDGLVGFVGLDLIEPDAGREMVVVEINPRPTTSYVGLCRLFGAGVVARLWLELFEGGVTGELTPLRGLVRFHADGTIVGAGAVA